MTKTKIAKLCPKLNFFRELKKSLEQISNKIKVKNWTILYLVLSFLFFVGQIVASISADFF